MYPLVGFVDNRVGYGCVGNRGIWELSVSSPQFCYEPWTVLKNWSNKKISSARKNKQIHNYKDFNNPQSIINRISEHKVSRDIADIMLNSERLNTFPLRLRKRWICPLPPLLLSIILEIPGRVVRQGKEIKCIQIEKEEIKLSLFAENIIFYVENPKGSTKKGATRTNK